MAKRCYRFASPGDATSRRLDWIFTTNRKPISRAKTKAASLCGEACLESWEIFQTSSTARYLKVINDAKNTRNAIRANPGHIFVSLIVHDSFEGDVP